MNVGQCIGELQLRISELEEGGSKRRAPAAAAEPEASVLEALRKADEKAAEAAERELATHLLLVKERRLLHAAQARIAELEKRPARDENYADLVDRNRRQAELLEGRRLEIGDLQAKLRGKDQALSELTRKLDAAEQRVRGLESFREHAASAVAAPCPVCTAIKHMVLGVAQPVQAPAPARKAPLGRYEVAPGSVRGVAQSIRDVLAKADRPLAIPEIAERIGLPLDKVATNLPHQLRNGALTRVGEPRNRGGKGNGYRYWLASRPLCPTSTTEEHQHADNRN